jgi:DNA invertase Pin-like site-specific DNA recombinase
VSPPIKKPIVQRTIALGYVRLSLTHDEIDLNSPERQRANIQAECDRRGWTPEWYEDVDGHKSGTKEENRPGWLALKERLGDPDVVSVVANDLSRVHRKGWRVGSLIDSLDQFGVALVLAAPGRNLDLSGPGGKITTMIIALMDEYYATDTSQKQKDSVQYRRTKGIIVGRVPFATVRNKEGYLQLVPDGIWILPDGTFIEGIHSENAPDEMAVWRGFGDAARRCLEIFAENRNGRRRVAARLNQEGYRFYDAEGEIALFNDDDIRRITANWVEYGGGLVPGKARNRRGKYTNPENVTLHPERAVFDVELCTQVGHVLQERSRDPKRNTDYAIHLDAKMYPLSKLVYCAHCEQLAQQESDSTLRGYLTGQTGRQRISRRYRHDTERHCDATRRSITADILERDFVKLLEALTVNTDVLPSLTQVLDHFFKSLNQSEEQGTAIQGEIIHWRQRAKNADTLFASARIGEEDWRELVENAEHEIARLQTQLTEQHEAEAAIKLTRDMVANLIHNWHQSKPEVRRSLAHSLFEYLVYDLDAQQIVNFKLTPWAELLMQLKLTYEEDKKKPLDQSGAMLYSGVPGGVQTHSRIITFHERRHAHHYLPHLRRQSGRTTIVGKTTAQGRDLSSLPRGRRFGGPGSYIWPRRSARPRHHRTRAETQRSLIPHCISVIRSLANQSN